MVLWILLCINGKDIYTREVDLIATLIESIFAVSRVRLYFIQNDEQPVHAYRAKRGRDVRRMVFIYDVEGIVYKENSVFDERGYIINQARDMREHSIWLV